LPRIPLLVLIWFGLWFGIERGKYISNFNFGIFVQETCIGISATLMLFYLSQWRTGWAARFLETAPIAFLGKISYSLYVIHAPILAICFVTGIKCGLTANLEMLGLLTVGVILSIAAAYGLRKAVEEPFLAVRPAPRPRRAAEPVARPI
jgi:peptidoglycan/LPS O-acetylase OafA/YrhL